MTLPTGVAYGTISWKAVTPVADTADAGSQPDARPVTGYITLNATVSELLVPASTPPVTIIMDEIRYDLDTAGVLRDAQGLSTITVVADSSGVYAVGTGVWNYIVTSYLNDGASRRTIEFHIGANEHVDLTNVTPVTGENTPPIIVGPQGPAGPTGPTGPAGADGTAAVTTHAAAADPHPTYLTAPEGDAAYVGLANAQTITGIKTFGVARLAATGTNTALGQGSHGVLTGGDNTAMGNGAQPALTTGTNNTAVGRSAQSALTTGQFNTAVGSYSLGTGATAGGNTAVGYAAMYLNTTGTNNTALGYGAGWGDGAGRQNILGFGNVYVGYNSANVATSDNSYQTAIGYSASVGGYCAMALGTNAAAVAAGAVAIGTDNAGAGATTSTINEIKLGTALHTVTVLGTMNVGNAQIRAAGTNTALGQNSHGALTTGNNNTAVGLNTQYSLTSGFRNAAFGSAVQQALSTGSDNVAVGDSAQLSLSTGSQNMALGYRAQANAVASAGNVAIGYESQVAVTGSYSVAVGWHSQYVMSSGANNVAMGTQAQAALTTGNSNTGLGHNAMFGAFSTSTASFQTVVGFESGLSSATQGDYITTIGWRAIAGATGAVALGASAQATHAGSVALGYATVSTGTDQVNIGPRDLEIPTVGKSVVIKSPNGTRYRIAVSDAGALSAVAA